MKNYYTDSDCKYSEIVIAMEDFSYGTYVKCTIPSILTFTGSEVNEKESKLNTSNIMNKNKEALGISSYNSCNYINIFIPKQFAPIDDFHKHIHNDIDKHVGLIQPILGGHIHINNPDIGNRVEDHIYHPVGKKGDKFIALFVGGDMNKCSIVGRYE